jgi:hypothetical protein
MPVYLLRPNHKRSDLNNSTKNNAAISNEPSNSNHSHMTGSHNIQALLSGQSRVFSFYSYSKRSVNVSIGVLQAGCAMLCSTVSSASGCTSNTTQLSCFFSLAKNTIFQLFLRPHFEPYTKHVSSASFSAVHKT